MRSFVGVPFSRTFYAAGQTGQQLLLGCYSAFQRQVGKGKITPYDRHDMLDLVVVDGKARGIIVRNRNKITLCDNCLRITVGTGEEDSLLIDALQSYSASI